MDDFSDSNKRRRGLGVVTPNACTECRKKRAKCDGESPCGRCVAHRHSNCVYQLPVRQSKDNMRSEMEQLRAQNQYNERFLAALVSNENAEHLVEQLRNGETIESVLERLEAEEGGGSKPGEERLDSGPPSSSPVTTYPTSTSAARYSQAIRTAARPPTYSIGSSPLSTVAYSDTYQSNNSLTTLRPWRADEGSTSIRPNNEFQDDDVMKWTPDSASSSTPLNYPLVGTWHHQTLNEAVPDAITQSMRAQGRETMLGESFGHGNQEGRTGTWTELTTDVASVEHLMALYFCWEYPTFASLSKEHFLDDFAQGRRRHCSSLLVNAMLAIGCRFSMLPISRTDPNDSSTSGNHFFAEASRLLSLEVDRHKLTTIQALGLMSIREASCGRSSEAIYYSGQSIRLAIEMGLHLESESGGGDHATLEQAVRSATFWGAFALDQCWSLSIGRLPQFSQNSNFTPTPSIVQHVEASAWIPYTDDGAPLERNCTQPSNVRSVYRTFCELSEIVHQALYIFYTPGNCLTSKKLLETYTKYLQWYDLIPEALRLGRNFTPAVLFAHMYYHYAILLTFRPFIKLDIVGSGVSPRDVCAQAADAIQTLTNSYAQLYTLQRTPSFVPYFVLTSTVAHLVIHGSGHSGAEAVHKGMSDLADMASSHNFAVRARDILRFLAWHWDIDIEWRDVDPRDPKSLCEERTSSMNLFCPNFENLQLKSTFRLVKRNGKEKEGDVRDENPLFWPFPLQGRPLLESGIALREAGFEMLVDTG